ncbi:NlpC/P60 family protein [Allofournierella massiliensis]|uniref:NlpC/P60 family protein n=1 Tax=Allofournierella massiliensis TaxID=1650663 RepID=A0ABT7UMI5_9FIRM|nr:NlpC/P60 family protein [Fournierella massiliensis]MDM8200111.1 NlpC/P60 family protein [Fournierella massiliensis]
MAEPEKQQFGDGRDNYAGAARQLSDTLHQAGQTGARQAVSNGAAALVQSGIKSGKAVSEIAAGTAAGGPWGAILSAAWSLRHTLFKILACLCVLLLIFVILIVSIPSVVLNGVFGLNGSIVDMDNSMSMMQSYEEMSAEVSAAVNRGYQVALDRVDQLIQDGGYDYELSIESLIDEAKSASGFNAAYVLAAYSASMLQQGTSADDMTAKLDAVAEQMFPISSEEKEKERVIPLTYTTYREVTVTVVYGQTFIGIVNGQMQFRYDVAVRGGYYEPDGSVTTLEPVTTTAYRAEDVTVPVYTDGRISGTTSATYYVPDGTETLTPSTETVVYLECTIHPFDQDVVLDAFGIDPDAPYDNFGITYGEAISNMATALQKTLYGAQGGSQGGESVPLTDEELIAFVERQNCNETRKHILSTALSLVGKVPYFWGGKSDAGWNDEWNTPKVVTATGSSATGTILPYGLDCSGYTDWVFKTAMGVSIKAGSWNQWDNSYAITEAELLPGDLGFMAVPGTVPVNHVLIYAGKNEDGAQMWVHCTSGSGVVLNSPDYVEYYRRPSNVDFDAPVLSGTGLQTTEPSQNSE